MNPLYVAYKQRWFDKNPVVKEFAQVFHGVSREEYQEIVNKQYAYFEKTDQAKNKKKKKRKDKQALQRADDLLAKMQSRQ